MPYKVKLKHAKNTEESGLSRGKVVGIATAHVYDTFVEAQTAMDAWLNYSGRERRASWSGQVITVEKAAS